MKFRILCILFSLSLTINAAEPVEIRLWENETAPSSNGISKDEEDNRNPDWVTHVSEPTITVYPADNPNGTALLMCPGGAYFGLATKHEGSDLAPDLNSKGITLAVLKYRLPNGHHEVPADDARQAIRLLRKNASRWGINPERIGIGGASAGGHLASTVATHILDEDSRVDFQVLLYPVISMKDEITHTGSRENLLGRQASHDLIDYYSNEQHITNNSPRAFIATSVDDNVVSVQNTYVYYDALTAHGVKVDMHIYPKGGHGWAYRPNQMPYHKQWVDDMTDWLANLYTSNTSPQSEWSGKTVAILGDSMSVPRQASDNKRFYNYLADMMGIRPLPYATSGHQWRDLHGSARRLSEEHGDSIDAILIWAGTNDFNASLPLGSFYNETEKMVNVNGKEVKRKYRDLNLDTKTFCGSINTVLKFLKETYPTKQIVILTPIHRGYAEFGEYNIQPSEEYANGLGLYIDDYITVLREAGSTWSVPVIDLFSTCGLMHKLDSFTPYVSNPVKDRLHPNTVGHKRIADTVSKQLNHIPATF